MMELDGSMVKKQPQPKISNNTPLAKIIKT
jgi:hypothetical protein